MVNDGDQAAVIDFDKAELGASKSSRACEMQYVKEVLDGVYLNWNGWPSEHMPLRAPIHSNHWSDLGSESGGDLE